MGKALYVGMVAKKSGHRVGAMSGIIVVRYKIPIPVSVEWLRLVGRVVIVSYTRWRMISSRSPGR